MKIQTKYNPGFVGWYLKDGVPTQAEVKAISIEDISKINMNSYKINYLFMGDRNPINENEIFETQKELYANL